MENGRNFQDNVFNNCRIEFKIAVIINICFAAQRVKLSFLQVRIPIAPSVGFKKSRETTTMTIVMLIIILIINKFDETTMWRLLIFVRVDVSMKFLASMLSSISIFFTKISCEILVNDVFSVDARDCELFLARGC